jgi:hypothetical protein
MLFSTVNFTIIDHPSSENLRRTILDDLEEKNKNDDVIPQIIYSSFWYHT